MQYTQFLNTTESLCNISQMLEEDISISYLYPNNPVLTIKKEIETPKGNGSTIKYFYKVHLGDYIFFDKPNYELFVLKEDQALKQIAKQIEKITVLN